MKKFQLARPCLADWFQYDVLLLDEAQDMNPAMLDVCLHQDRPKVVVGDPNQQIYSFRGAVNALAKVEEHPVSGLRNDKVFNVQLCLGESYIWLENIHTY